MYFGMGDGGGAEMRLRRYVVLNCPMQVDCANIVRWLDVVLEILARMLLPKTLTQLDFDVDIFVAFLQKIANDELSGDFFVMLLNEYALVQGSTDIQPRLYVLTLLFCGSIH